MLRPTLWLKSLVSLIWNNVSDALSDWRPHDTAQLLVGFGLRPRGIGSRIRINRRRPTLTVESEPSSMERKTAARPRPVMSQYSLTVYVTRLNG
jgi:hypothetical protein